MKWRHVGGRRRRSHHLQLYMSPFSNPHLGGMPTTAVVVAVVVVTIRISPRSANNYEEHRVGPRRARKCSCGKAPRCYICLSAFSSRWRRIPTMKRPCENIYVESLWFAYDRPWKIQILGRMRIVCCCDMFFVPFRRESSKSRIESYCHLSRLY
jgi:hypothetical protein